MAYNKAVETFRDEEYPMMKGKAYLDHGGATIYSRSLVEQFSERMISNLYGNPHSASDPAELSGSVVDSVRERALRFFNADPEHFDLVFTANATASIKLVAESFRDLAASAPSPTSLWYGYHKDAHTSVVGGRAFTGNNHHCFTSDQEVEDWLDCKLSSLFPNGEVSLGLFAYPGQSNMTGRRLPLRWTRRLRSSSHASHRNTYSLLDAAALATTSALDFSDPDSAPDFTACSFYKIFGFPDLGGLIIRKQSGHILSWRQYFGGGTISGLTVLQDPIFRRRSTTLHDGLEDGTLPFHSIVALDCALDVHAKLYGSMDVVSKHTSFLINRLYSALRNLTYDNGRPLCEIYTDEAPNKAYTSPLTQGATVAFNLFTSSGDLIGHSTVERLANESQIYIRAGGLCNPGGIASYLKLSPWHLRRNFSAGYRCDENKSALDIISGTRTGVVRASLGAMSTIADVDALVRWLDETFLVECRGPSIDLSGMAASVGGVTLNDLVLVNEKHFVSNGELKPIKTPSLMPSRRSSSLEQTTKAPTLYQLNTTDSYLENAKLQAVTNVRPVTSSISDFGLDGVDGHTEKAVKLIKADSKLDKLSSKKKSRLFWKTRKETVQTLHVVA